MIMAGSLDKQAPPDRWLLITAGALSLCGVLVNASAGGSAAGLPRWLWQTIWAALGLVTALLVSRLDSERLRRAAPYLYAGALLLLVLTLVWPDATATRRWITLGPINIQTSEPAKATFILAAAWFLLRRDEEKLKRHGPMPIQALTVVLLALPSLGLIAVQPDLATAFVFVPLTLGLLYWAGVPGWKLAALLLIPAWALTALTPAPEWVIDFIGSEAASPLGALLRPWWWLGAAVMLTLWLSLRRRTGRFFGWLTLAGAAAGVLLPPAWGLLKEYQRRRVLMFLDPTADPKGAGYNIIQSRIAIGSGGWFGKGFQRGSQGKLAFLPERHTDFAFSVWAEEWGYVGSAIMILLYVFLVARMVRTASRAPDTFSSLVAYGLAVMLAFHALFNIGMCLGVFPVAGLPLPFVSYGGSFMLTAWAAVGFCAGIERRTRSLSL
jgi:rod shape determining protein RodA